MSDEELREAIIRTSSVIIGENSLGYIYEELPDAQIDAIMQLLHQYGNTRELEGKEEL